MPKFFHLGRGKKKQIRKKRNFKLLGKINFRTFNTLIFTSLIVLFLFYLAQINALSTKGYIISDLEEQITSLRKQNSSLEVNVLALQTTNGIEEKLNGLGMVTTANIDYLKIKEPTVAYK